MQLEFSSIASKQFKKLPPPEKTKVFKKIQLLKQDPFIGKKLKGEFSHLRSLKAWPYRIIYHYSPAEQILFIENIEHRQQVYK